MWLAVPKSFALNAIPHIGLIAIRKEQKGSDRMHREIFGQVHNCLVNYQPINWLFLVVGLAAVKRETAYYPLHEHLSPCMP